MRAVKVIIAIITTIIGIAITIGAVAIIGFGVVLIIGAAGVGNTLDSMVNSLGDAFRQIYAVMAAFFGVILIFVGLVAIVPGIIYLILGIKFFSGRPNKGIAITLIVFYFLGIGGTGLTLADGIMFETLIGTIFFGAMIALLVLYLVLLGKKEKQGEQQHVQPPPQQQQPQMNFDPNTGQRLN